MPPRLRGRQRETPDRRRRPVELVASLAFLASGAAGLMFETTWFHRSALVLGNSSWATAIVLSSFMGGLALGAVLVLRRGQRVRRWFNTYAALEIIVAVTGVALTLGLPHLTRVIAPMARAAGDAIWLVNILRLATAFSLLVVPATAMGATLPAIVAALCSIRPEFGQVLGRLYGWNTLGAVAGVMAAELLLIPSFGVMGTAWIAALLNVGAAAAALWISRQERDSPAPSSSDSLARPEASWQLPWRLLTCALLTGFGLMGLEGIWFRLLSMLVVNNTLAMSVMLAVVLAGIGLGGLVASRLAVSRRSDETGYLPALMFAIAAAVVISYATLRLIADAGRATDADRVLWLAMWLTFPTALLSGIVFTVLGARLKRTGRAEAPAAAWLLTANTVGAMAGPLVATFVLLPMLGMERSLFGLAALYVLAGVLVPREPQHQGRVVLSWSRGVGGLVGFALLVLFPFGLMSGHYFILAAREHTADGSEIVGTREGRSETIFLARQDWMGEPLYYRLVTNGFSMSGTAVPAKRYMRQFVYLPMLLHEQPLRRVLVVCYGVGVTAGAVTDISSVQSIDVAEISPDVVAMSDVIYAKGDHPLHDPRVRLHLEDGRFFLQTTAERFDLITGEPPPPLTPGTVNIYTKEYFELIRDRLNDGGIATYWLPVARQEGVDHTTIIRAFCDAFVDCSLWNGTPNDLMLMGTRGLTAPSTAVHFSKAWSDPVLGPHLREIGFERPEQIGAAFVGDADYLRRLTSDSLSLDDDHPRRLRMARTAGAPRGSGAALDQGDSRYVQDIIDPRRTRTAFESSTYIRQVWPEPLRTQTLDYFDVQRMINRVLIEGANPLGQIEDVHRLLTQTSLERLPYWFLGFGNHPILSRADVMPNDGTGQVEYVRGIRALVGRDYPAAVTFLEQAQERGFKGSRPLFVYALCLAGNRDAARHFAQGAESINPDQRHFWDWMKATYGFAPGIDAL